MPSLRPHSLGCHVHDINVSASAPPPHPFLPLRSIITPCTSNLRVRLNHSDDELFVDFVAALLSLDPDRRPTAAQALQHPWFRHDYNASPPSRAGGEAGAVDDEDSGSGVEGADTGAGAGEGDER